jgi:DNA polymerase-1
LLSLALAGRSQAVAFALDHPQARWTKTEREKIDRLLQVVFEGTVLVAHNLAFDLEWVAQRVGQKYARSAEYHCTMQQAYVLDERPNSHSLDFCSMLNFGLPLKAQSNVDHNNLQSEELGHLLRYNGGDAVVCRKLFISQRRQLQSLDLSGAYEEHRRRIPTVVLSQILGFPLDQARVEAFDAEYQKKITEALDGIDADPAVAEYKKRFGQFLATSPQNVVLLFRDVLKRGEGRAAKSKKYSVDKKVLEQIDLPIARHVLSLRALSKNHGTYIQPLLKKHERSVVWPDGLLHTQFNTTFTATGRLSSNDPNMQNYPKRNPVSKKIRQAFVAPPGHMIVAVDFGQLEARVIGLMSGDPVLCDALFTDYDIHMVWAEKIVKAWPETCRARHKDLTGKGLKAFRSDVKNQMVFPCFYGSVCSSCARSLEMPREVLQPIYDEFWREFFGVLRWQRRLKQFYAEHGYVECMTGRRRHGPMSSNMVINSPVQGTASDIVVDSMNRLSEYAQETEMWWFQPRLNIHDDLTFIVPEKDLDQTLETIINMMLACPYDWITVPMQVEVEIGRDWYHMEDVGKFKSSHVKKDLSRGSQTK